MKIKMQTQIWCLRLSKICPLPQSYFTSFAFVSFALSQTVLLTINPGVLPHSLHIQMLHTFAYNILHILGLLTQILLSP